MHTRRTHRPRSRFSRGPERLALLAGLLLSALLSAAALRRRFARRGLLLHGLGFRRLARRLPRALLRGRLARRGLLRRTRRRFRSRARAARRATRRLDLDHVHFALDAAEERFAVIARCLITRELLVGEPHLVIEIVLHDRLVPPVASDVHPILGGRLVSPAPVSGVKR